jgi:protease-4
MLRALASLLAFPFRLLFAGLRFLLLPFPRSVPAYVELRLKGGLVWRKEPPRGLERFLRRRDTAVSVEGVRRALTEIGRTPGVRGAILRIEELHGTPARVDGLREVLEAFRRDTGKEVIAYVKSADTSDYPLLAAASRVILAPGGPLQLLGHAASVSSYRDLLERLGIAPEFFRKGRFKSAPETFTRRDVSPEARLVVNEVLDRRHRRLVAAVARRLGSEAAAERAIDGGPYTSRGAKAAGLVDDLAYPDELPAILAAPRADSTPRNRAPKAAPAAGDEGAGERRPAGAAAPESPRREDSAPERPTRREAEVRIGTRADLARARRFRVTPPRLRSRPRIEHVHVAGLIKPGKSFRWPGGPELAGEETVVASLDEARKNRRVRAVVVSVDSRGGAAPASELIWRAVVRCAEEKPTVAWVDHVAASGGYFAAAGARRIVAGSQALVGSIGVFAGRFDATALWKRLGIHREVFLRGAHAGLLSPAHPLTDEEREHLQREVEEIYEQFVACVARGRRRPEAEIRAVAEGRVHVAAAAPAALVDEVGLFPTALAWAAREIGADPADIELHERPRGGLRPDLRELLSLAESFAVARPLLLWPEVVEVR